jgi:hypothetical protein
MRHVANGGATTKIIRQAGIEGDLSIWADVLYEGPVPGGLSDRELRQIRARFLAGPDNYDETLAGLEGWVALLDRHAADDELILWFEHDLFDQLNLIQILDRLASSRPFASRATLICINAFPGRPSFKGLGELTPGELASLLGTRQAVTDRQYEVARLAWAAFRADDPRAVEDVMAKDLSALPFLGQALRRHLEEFPSTINGLSRSETRLLQIVSRAPVETWTAFPRMHEGEISFYITDSSLWSLVTGLASLEPALAAIEGDVRGSESLPRCMVGITPAGRDVLDGSVDRVRTYGIDRWLGGVHLEGYGPVWRWNATTGRMVRE